MKKRFIVLILVVLAIAIGGVYYGYSYEEKPDTNIKPVEVPESGNVQVDSLEILTLESWPLQIQVVAKGDTSDGCTSVVEKENTLIEDTFYVTLDYDRDPEAFCIQVITPYEKSIPLNVYGLDKGEYKVNVNGVETSFILEQDNKL